MLMCTAHEIILFNSIHVIFSIVSIVVTRDHEYGDCP